MKKLIVIIAIASINSLVFAASITQTVEVPVGTPAASISITPPPAFNWGLFSIGTNDSPARTVSVTSGSNYDLFIRCDNTETFLAGSTGNMSEWDGVAYVTGGRKIRAKLQWYGGDQATFIDITSTDSSVLINKPSTTITTNVFFRQVIDMLDVSLASNIYRIILTFTAIERP